MLLYFLEFICFFLKKIKCYFLYIWFIKATFFLCDWTHSSSDFIDWLIDYIWFLFLLLFEILLFLFFCKKKWEIKNKIKNYFRGAPCTEDDIVQMYSPCMNNLRNAVSYWGTNCEETGIFFNFFRIFFKKNNQKLIHLLFWKQDELPLPPTKYGLPCGTFLNLNFNFSWWIHLWWQLILEKKKRYYMFWWNLSSIWIKRLWRLFSRRL